MWHIGGWPAVGGHRCVFDPWLTSPFPYGPVPDTPKVKGPASYFPSIEKTYGQPIAHWMALLERAGTKKHGEFVTLLKTEHGLGHGHANALVAAFLAKKG